jgi:aldose 1-epimerase
MDAPPTIGGAPAVTLTADPPAGRPGIVEATVLPGRGFMLLQAVAAWPDGRRTEILHAPPLAEAALALAGSPEDFAGNRTFAFGGALLAPYANRIRGRSLAETREIETAVDGRRVRLPRNWGGRGPGAEAYAMHGLILAAHVEPELQGPGAVRGRLDRLDDRWPGQIELAFEWRLADGALRLSLEARNRGAETAPFGAGWHPYFRLPSGDRRQARLTVPARRRTEVNDYDEVLPTGRLLEVAGTPYDFRKGQALGDLYLDDCFTGLAAGPATVEVVDPAAGLGVRITAASPPVKAVQVYAPPDQAFVVVEPQFNLADPFGAAWPADVDTGMVRLAPGDSVAYDVALAVFAPEG